ncbi:hypothetical protein [Nocardia nepalensis]|uniref:hypothetical protein n=1 Tax=Nocardia nepalensis TaxID=3375448 RepID=UPI003B67AFDF
MEVVVEHVVVDTSDEQASRAGGRVGDLRKGAVADIVADKAIGVEHPNVPYDGLVCLTRVYVVSDDLH